MSLIEQHKNNATALFTSAKRRVVADFRDFSFTWGGFWRWTGTVVMALLVATLITLYFLDWNQLRGPIGRYLSHRSGRLVRIDGNLAVDIFTWQPKIDVGGLYIGNPAWVGRPQGANVNHARVEVRLVPLLFGNLILPLVSIDKPVLLVVRDATGRTNWDSDSKDATGWKLPPIHRFLINQGHVEVDDAVRNLKFTGTINSQEKAGGKGAAFSMDGDGTLNGNKFLAQLHGGPLLNVDEANPYNFAADIHAGETHAVIDGSVTHPFHLDRFTATVTFSGPTLADLYYLTGVTLPGTRPYIIKGLLERDGAQYRFTGLSGMVGGSDMNGDLALDVSGAVPMLTGRLASRQLDFDDLGALFRRGETAPAQSAYFMPDVPLRTERLRQMNAEVDYSAVKVQSRDFPLQGFGTHISVESGVLDLKPLAFNFSQGKLSGELKIDGRGDVPVTSLDARITDIHIENFIKGGEKPVSGMVEARAQLTGHGKSVHAAASTANGTVTVVIPSGAMKHSLAEWLGVNVLSALGLTLSGDQSNTNVRCAVANFTAKDGVMTARQFVFDTDPVRVDGKGTVDLKNEAVDLSLQGKPKSFQLLRLKAPITVKGSLGAPVLGVDAGAAITQGGIGAALAFISPFAAVLAFIDPGLAKDANCAGLLTDAKAKGAPVKASAVKKAAEPKAK